MALAFHRCEMLDLVGPCEVFAMANRVSRRLRAGAADPYAVEIVSITPNSRIEATSGLVLLAGSSLSDLRGSIDTILIPGGGNLEIVTADAAFMEWLRRASSQVRRIGSVCTGAFVLAAAGLLNGRCATTHWDDCDGLARQYPEISVEPDRIYVRDGNVYTSAGVTAGMDLALALVEEDLGREMALRVARILVMFVRRPGGQSQFSALLESQSAERMPMRELLVWAAENPQEDLSVEALAARVNMSTRNFSRAFHKGIGKTPARFVESLRVEAARRMLEETAAKLDQIAKDCGFGSGNSMRRSFLRILGVPPSDYRERFRRA